MGRRVPSRLPYNLTTVGNWLQPKQNFECDLKKEKQLVF